MKKQGALSKFEGGEIDNQWFKGAKMTIVPRPSQESRKRVALKEQRLHTPPQQAVFLPHIRGGVVYSLKLERLLHVESSFLARLGRLLRVDSSYLGKAVESGE